MVYDDIKTKKGSNAVFGIFDTRAEMENAVNVLRTNNFRNSDISVLMPHEEGGQHLGHEKGTKAPEGAVAGAASGFAIGGTLGWLLGIGALTIPGVGPFLAAGPIIAAAAGAGLGSAIGGLTGTLVGIGIPEYEAKRYESLIEGGGTLLSVHVDDAVWAEKAKDILAGCGAKEVAIASEVRAPGSFSKDSGVIDTTPPM